MSARSPEILDTCRLHAVARRPCRRSRGLGNDQKRRPKPAARACNRRVHRSFLAGERTSRNRRVDCMPRFVWVLRSFSHRQRCRNIHNVSARILLSSTTRTGALAHLHTRTIARVSASTHARTHTYAHTQGHAGARTGLSAHKGTHTPALRKSQKCHKRACTAVLLGIRRYRIRKKFNLQLVLLADAFKYQLLGVFGGIMGKACVFRPQVPTEKCEQSGFSASKGRDLLWITFCCLGEGGGESLVGNQGASNWRVAAGSDHDVTN